MRVFSADSIRNVAVIAHGGSGKTSLVDAALYDAGGAVIAREGIPAPIVNAFLSENAE